MNIKSAVSYGKSIIDYLLFKILQPSMGMCRLEFCETNQPSVSSAIEIMRDAFVWKNVPKRRRTIEKRKTRRMGFSFVKKNLTVNDNITICNSCGTYHQYHTLCPTCYQKTKVETEKILNDNPSKRPNLHEFKIMEEVSDKNSWFSENLLKKAIKSN
ncbi:39S ribosomal protein L32, mitochondrial [Intoshia linei]|uniref:Large ribosomal subunit protein bL32m n=1 Tax=Intoshia linei TaxID=1819745 RepID=A0A177B4T2_9BILA|nr:39S ribosomal protein L32, mitochondrial [Intoshia linei]